MIFNIDLILFFYLYFSSISLRFVHFSNINANEVKTLTKIKLMRKVTEDRICVIKKKMLFMII